MRLPWAVVPQILLLTEDLITLLQECLQKCNAMLSGDQVLQEARPCVPSAPSSIGVFFQGTSIEDTFQGGTEIKLLINSLLLDIANLARSFELRKEGRDSDILGIHNLDELKDSLHKKIEDCLKLVHKCKQFLTNLPSPLVRQRHEQRPMPSFLDLQI